VIGLEGGGPDHNGTHWHSQLIRRKGRLPNRSMHTIQRLGCQSGRLWWQLASVAEHWPTSTGRSADGCDPRNRIGLVVPSIAHAIISLCSIVNWQS
jgi:hypothetical protein